MALAADRMKAMRERRRARGLRELRLIVPDARSKVVRRRIAKEVAGLDRSRELDALEINGLRVKSQVMADKPVTIRRERIGRQIGHLDDKDVARLNIALAFAMGLAD
jgi:mRNA interferase MazF